MKKRADGRWQKRITLPNGKSKILYSTASSERLAVKDFNDQMLKIQSEVKNTTLFSNIAEKWNAEYREKVGEINYRKATKSSYEKVMNEFGGSYIAEITPTDVHRFINKLIKQGLSHKTIATAKGTFSMICDYAILNDGAIASNPAQVITLPSNLPKTARTLPTDDELTIVNANYHGFAFLPYFLLNTGLRKSEALALNYSDIDFEKKTITVNKHLIHDGNKPVLEHKTKTQNSVRTVILLDRVAEKIDRTKSGILFANPSGSYYTKREYATQWAKYTQNLNINVTAHQLRHGFATMLFEAGIDLKDAQDLMGHSDIKTTQTIYTHIRDKRKEETAQKLNSFSFK